MSYTIQQLQAMDADCIAGCSREHVRNVVQELIDTAIGLYNAAPQPAQADHIREAAQMVQADHIVDADKMAQAAPQPAAGLTDAQITRLASESGFVAPRSEPAFYEMLVTFARAIERAALARQGRDAVISALQQLRDDGPSPCDDSQDRHDRRWRDHIDAAIAAQKGGAK